MIFVTGLLIAVTVPHESGKRYIQHRLVYQILEEEKIVKIIRMWTHYE